MRTDRDRSASERMHASDFQGGRPSRDGIEKRCMPALKAPFVFARRCVARLAKERENFVRERVGRRSRTCTYSIAVGLASVFESLDRSPSAEARTRGRLFQIVGLLVQREGAKKVELDG